MNEELLEDSIRLNQGDVVQLGKVLLFRFNHPVAAKQMIERGETPPTRSARLIGSESAKEEAERLAREKQLDAERAELEAQREEIRARAEEDKRQHEAKEAERIKWQEAAKLAAAAEQERIRQKEKENEDLRLKLLHLTEEGAHSRRP